jgi:hypothetical protein
VKLWPFLLDPIVSLHVPLLSDVLLPDHFILHTSIVFSMIAFLSYTALVLIGIWAAIVIGKRLHQPDRKPDASKT